MNTSRRAAYDAQRHCADTRALCHAPALNMYFGMTGTVGACCYNRSEAYGQYPQSSVRELWDSAHRKALEAAMLTPETPLAGGCRLCALPYEAGNFQGMVARAFDSLAPAPAAPVGWLQRAKDRLRLAPGPYPRQMDFELSNTCNLECSMCNGWFSSLIREKREKLPPIPCPYDSAFVTQLREFIPHLKRARFYGGEPFLIPIYHEIWDAMIELNEGMEVVITTNGTVLNERVKRVLDRLNGLLVMSIDSRVKSTYEKIRVGANYAQVMRNVDAFVERLAGQGRLSMAVCPMPVNADEIPDLLDWCNGHGVRIHFNVVSQPAGASLRSLSIEALRALSQRYDAVDCPQGSALERDNAQAFEGLRLQLRHWAESAVQAHAKFSPLVGLLGQAEARGERLLAEVVRRELDLRVRAHAPADALLACDEEMPRLDFLFSYLRASGEAYLAEQRLAEPEALAVRRRLAEVETLIRSLPLDPELLVRNVVLSSPCLTVQAVLRHDDASLARMMGTLAGHSAAATAATA